MPCGPLPRAHCAQMPPKVIIGVNPQAGSVGMRAAANLAAALEAVNLQQPPHRMPTVPEDTELAGTKQVRHGCTYCALLAPAE
jgi:hypothetical protein